MFGRRLLTFSVVKDCYFVWTQIINMSILLLPFRLWSQLRVALRGRTIFGKSILLKVDMVFYWNECACENLGVHLYFALHMPRVPFSRLEFGSTHFLSGIYFYRTYWCTWPDSGNTHRRWETKWLINLLNVRSKLSCQYLLLYTEIDLTYFGLIIYFIMWLISSIYVI